MKPKMGFLEYLVACFVVAFGMGSKASTMAHAAENKTAMAVNVGVVLDLSSLVGKIDLSCINASLHEFYASHPHHSTTIILHVRDSKADVVGAATQAMDLIQNNKVEAIMGPEGWSEAYFLIKLAEKAEVPIISFAPTAATCSNCLMSSNLFRVAQNHSSQIYAIRDIFKAFNWRQAVVIYQGDEFGRLTIADLVEALPSIRIDRSVIDLAASNEHIREELHRLSSKQVKVFIVHMVHTLATQVFTMAYKTGMMCEGYAWILTDTTTNVLNTFDSSILSSMQGVLGLQAYVPQTVELHKFTTRWRRKFQQDNPNIDNPQVGVYGLWAYDAAWALAMAVEISGIDPKFSNGVSQNGKKISGSLSKTKFKGLTGEFSLVKGQLEAPNLQILNVIGDGVSTVGYWTPEMGLTADLNWKRNLKPIIWPGYSITVPKGWGTPLHEEKILRIGVPLNTGFSEFARVLKNGTIFGYCIDIFDAVVAELPFLLLYQYIPFADTQGRSSASYNDLIVQVSEGIYDAAVGDITILANRSLSVDFTLPYTEVGIVVVVPIRHNVRNHTWVFLKPLTLKLLLTTFCLFVFIGFIVWILEYPNNQDFRQGPPSHRIGTSLWFSFCIMVFAQREPLMSNLSRFVLVIWLFVVFILTQFYTASLTSWLTVQQLQPTTDIDQIIKNNWRVGYQEGSYVLERLQFLGIKDLVAYTSEEHLHELFTKGSCNGGIDAAIDEIPYMKLFLSKHSDNYAMGDSQYNSNGFGLAFPIGSSLVDDMSKAVLNVTQSDKMNQIQEKWFGKKISHPPSTSLDASSSPSVDLSYFWSLFLIAASAAIFALFLYFCRRLLHTHTLSLSCIYFHSTLWRKIATSFHLLSLHGHADEPPMAVAMAVVQAPQPPPPPLPR